MIILDQFVYTAAETQSKTGYQVIARSLGISEETISQLNQYVFPLGIDPSEFNESRSMLILKDKKIAFSKIKNIGRGYDGRSDTFYNHTIVLNLNDFQKIDNDTRILENFYFENSRIQGSLPQLRIEPQKISLVLEINDDILTILYEVLLALFNKEKIAILGNQNPELIPKILSLVPPSVRLLSFSTMVNDTTRQSGYDFILTSKTSRSLLDKKFTKIDFTNKTEPVFFQKQHYEESISLYFDSIFKKEADRISEIFERFEFIPGTDYKNKITMLIYLDKLERSTDKLEKQDCAYIVLSCLKKLDDKTALEYFNKIKESLHHEDVLRHGSEFEIKNILTESMEVAIEKNMLEKWLGHLSDGTSESRLKLLQELFAKRKQDFIENGSSLLIDCRYSFYRPDIYRFFVETQALHTCIFKTFENKDLMNVYKHKIAEAIWIQCAKYNLLLLSKLISYKIFDLEDEYEIKDFQNIIKEVFSISELYKADFELVISLVEKIYSKVNNTIFQDKKSGTTVLPTSIIKQLITIIRILLDFVENFKTSLTQTQKIKIQPIHKKLSDFIKRYDVDDSASWNPFSYFR